MQEVINNFKNHRGMSPDNAEFSYIIFSSQELDGYGQETYPSKVRYSIMHEKNICNFEGNLSFR